MTAVLGFLLLLALPASAAERTSPVEIGRHGPLLQFTDRSGREHDIDWKGGERANIFFFFDSRSKESFMGLSLLESFYRKIGDFGVRIFAIEASGLDDAAYSTAMERYHQLYGEPSFPVVLDPEFSLSALFGIQGVPSSYLLERHGVALYKTADFDDVSAVGLAIRTERLLGQGERFLSSSLEEVGIDGNTEKALRAAAAAGRSRRRVPAGLLEVGDKVQPFDVVDLEGREQRITWSGDKGLSIVFFWGALCLPCIQEMGYLESIYRSAGEYNLDIVAVEATGLSVERTAAVIRRYERFQPRPSYAIVPDTERRISGIFGVSGKIPQTFFISTDGAIVYHTDEFINEGAGGLARRIERAIGAEAGTLQSSGNGASAAAPSAVGSSPDRGSDESVFRSNLVQGDSYYNNWEFDKALPHYLRCLDMQPNHVYLRRRVGEIFERQGEFEEAIVQWQKILATDPDNVEADRRITDLRAMQNRAGEQP